MAVNIGNLVAGESEIELSYISIPALKGDKGDTGRGISSVIKTSTVGLVDTWTITYTDGSTSSFDVTNGADGDDYVITEADYEEIADIVLDNIEIPTKVSDLDNDEGFIDNTVNDLQNYYKKSETYTKQEVDGKVSSVYKYKGSVATYQDLPSTSLTIGDVYNVESTGDNYAWTGTVWDKLGGDIDLSNYYNKTQTDTLLNGKQDTLESGTNIKTINNQSILGSGNITIQGGGGTSDYTDLTNKPSINNVTLSGNKVLSEFGIQPSTDISLQTNNKTVTSAINEVNSIAKGANQALSYASYQAMVTAFNSLANNVYNVGQNVMIVTLQVPDLWISGIESTSSTYTYTTDEAITTALETTGYIQVGYYRLSALETQKVDLTDYETSNNKVTSISSSSTNTEYPSAKCVHDSQATQDDEIEALQTENARLKATLPTTTGEGQDITLDKTAELDFVKPPLPRGNSEQEGEPSPDNEVPITNVTGNVEVTISNNDNSESKTLPVSLGDIELCKIGNYQDYLYKNNGKWYKHNAINKLVLNGSENWSVSNNVFFLISISDYINSSGKICLSDKYTAINNTNAGTSAITQNNSICFFATNAVPRLYIRDERFNNANAFKAELSENNAKLYYPTVTPTDTEITDATLISQLEEISKALSYQGQTNITSDTIALFDVEAYQDLKIMKVTSISSSSTDNEYPSAKAVYDYIQSLNGDEVSY